MFHGTCINGPINGTLIASRYRKGFLLVNKEKSLFWTYNWDGTNFVSTDKSPSIWKFNESISIRDNPEYDIISTDWCDK